MSAYYNEWDTKKAEWLRELIRMGLIADGDVDERSVADVAVEDLAGYDQCHFFAGIGIWSFALRAAGWPDDRSVWTGSCPCQPFSAAGQQKGHEDERHLWPHWYRLLVDAQPGVVFGEQVSGKPILGATGRPAVSAAGNGPPAWFDVVCDELEAASYAVGASALPACSVGAPHIRQRLWFVAERVANSHRQRDNGTWSQRSGRRDELAVSGLASGLADTGGERREGQRLHVQPRQQGQAVLQATWRGEADRLADGSRSGRSQKRAVRGRSSSRDSTQGLASRFDAGGSSDRLADADGKDACAEREQRGGEHGQQPQDGSAGVAGPCTDGSLWEAADWLFCTDAKWRPVEPGTFPLVDGPPVRVVRGSDPRGAVDSQSAESRSMRISGYGDGIVAPLATAFIKAYLLAIGDIHD